MLELLKNHPNVTKIVKDYYLEKMLESLKDDSLPENFKEFVREQGIEDDKIAKILESAPRNLFDVFDNHELYIIINVKVIDVIPSFSYKFYHPISDLEIVTKNWYNSRKDAETEAIVQAFALLEKALTIPEE